MPAWHDPKLREIRSSWIEPRPLNHAHSLRPEQDEFVALDLADAVSYVLSQKPSEVSAYTEPEIQKSAAEEIARQLYRPGESLAISYAAWLVSQQESSYQLTRERGYDR